MSELTPLQLPTILLHVGCLEIWDIKKKTGDKAEVAAIDEGLAWFPGGDRLAYVKLVESQSSTNSKSAPPDDAFPNWDRVPAVFVRDVAAGTDTFLHVGWRPVVSYDGLRVLVSDLAGNWKSVDPTTGNSEDVTWRGIAWRGAIACPAKNIVLSWCLPTEGAKIKHTEHYSPLSGPRQLLTLKLARLNTDEFQTVRPYMDPRLAISFGEVRNGQDK